MKKLEVSGVTEEVTLRKNNKLLKPEDFEGIRIELHGKDASVTLNLAKQSPDYVYKMETHYLVRIFS